MDCLPSEIQVHIGRLLATDDDSISWNALASLRQASRRWCGIITPLFYRSLTVTFWDRTSLEYVISQLVEDGPGGPFLKHARKVQLLCIRSAASGLKEWPWTAREWAWESLRYNRANATVNKFLELHSLGPLSLIGLKYWGPYGEGWEPIICLIERLFHLAELDFIIEMEFPPALKEAIARNHPTCLLNLWWHGAVGYTILPDPKSLKLQFDMDTLYLPGLHTLALTLIEESNNDNTTHYLLPVLLAAPNLKHLIIEATTNVGPSDPIIQALKAKGNQLALSIWPTPKAALESITIHEPDTQGCIISKLAAITDLSSIRSLEISSFCDPARLAQIASTIPHIKRLFIYVGAPGMHYVNDDDDDDETLAALQIFDSLEYLQICGLRGALGLRRVLGYHGRSLKGLKIVTQATAGAFYGGAPPRRDNGHRYPEILSPDIIWIAQHCPNLQELRLPVQRHMGSYQECQLYKALGQLSSLQHLVLDLHFDPRERPIPVIGYLDPPSLRKAIIKAATDESLALEIWHLISSNQLSHHLRHLRIVPFGERAIRGAPCAILHRLSRSFLVTRYNQHTPGLPVVEEIGGKIRARRLKSLEKFDPVTDEIEQILNDIWPGGSGDSWKSSWTSFPIQSEEV